MANLRERLEANTGQLKDLFGMASRLLEDRKLVFQSLIMMMLNSREEVEPDAQGVSREEIDLFVHETMELLDGLATLNLVGNGKAVPYKSVDGDLVFRLVESEIQGGDL